jgi:hypothetical protein
MEPVLQIALLWIIYLFGMTAFTMMKLFSSASEGKLDKQRMKKFRPILAVVFLIPMIALLLLVISQASWAHVLEIILALLAVAIVVFDLVNDLRRAEATGATLVLNLFLIAESIFLTVGVFVLTF